MQRRGRRPPGHGLRSPRQARGHRGALALCVPLSLLSGATAGGIHGMGVAAGWAYNLLLKRTVLSPIPYAVGFGSLPAFVTLGLHPSVWPAWWAMAAGALLGVAAHLANVLPDIDDDLASGVRGLPQRLGRPACRVLAPIVTLAALGVLIAGPPGGVRLADWVLGAAATAVTVLGTALPTASGSRWPFRAAIIGSTIAVALLLLRGADMA
ncbi:UbiA family prenyltransferase [Streptomyces hundungensis]|nr:UbiA family prenyltransferase [Streptomyces hundungensis]